MTNPNKDEGRYLRLEPGDIVIEDWSSKPRSQWPTGRVPGLRVTHVETDLCVEVDSENSRYDNREKALHVLCQMLADKERHVLPVGRIRIVNHDHWHSDLGRQVYLDWYGEADKYIPDGTELYAFDKHEEDNLALIPLFERYLAIAQSDEFHIAWDDDLYNVWKGQIEGDECNIEAMCRTAIERIGDFDYGKLNRWLGFIQGVLFSMRLISIKEERDLTRPIFNPDLTKPIITAKGGKTS